MSKRFSVLCPYSLSHFYEKIVEVFNIIYRCFPIVRACDDSLFGKYSDRLVYAAYAFHRKEVVIRTSVLGLFGQHLR